MAGKTRGWSLATLLIASAALAQAPVVPQDHYGPPACTANAAAPIHSTALERAHQEQQQGADDPHTLPSSEPLENFALLRYKLAQYADCTGTSGCYWADLDAQFQRAEASLDTRLSGRRKDEKLAIVMDIDETTLSSYCEMKREDFGYIGPMFNSWIVSPEASIAVPGALRLFNKAKSAGVAVFFITGRPGVPDYSNPAPQTDQTPATARNLESAGFHGWTGLALRNGGENSMPTIDYKSDERRRIAYKGYRIVLSVGDQWSDLLGDPRAEISIKLPNPFYFLP